MKRILFVCTGNTCRSLMAEGIALKMLRSLNLEGEIEVSSAGLAAFPDAPGSPEALGVLSGEGIDLSDHRAVQLNSEMVRRADLILTMTASQKRQVLELFPEARGKVYILKEFVDPVAHPEENLRLTQLVDLIKEKRERFRASYGVSINRLEQERAEILKRLQQIENELAYWQCLLEEEIYAERMEIQEIEDRLKKYDIEDPYGKSRQVYELCASELKGAINDVFKLLTGREDAF